MVRRHVRSEFAADVFVFPGGKVDPEDREPLHDARESTEGVWIAPREALTRSELGAFPLVYATVKHLERMAHYSTIESLVASVTEADLVAVTPRIIQRDGETLFLLP